MTAASDTRIILHLAVICHLTQVRKMLKDLTDLGLSGEAQTWAPVQVPQTGPKKQKIVNFKETWCAGHAVACLKECGLYEAGGSIFWIDLLSRGDINGHDCTVKQVMEARSCFDIAYCKDERLIYPAVLDVFVRNITDIPGPKAPKEKEDKAPTNPYPKSLTLLTGHTILYAYWASLYSAFQDANSGRVTMLVQAGLTCTVRVHLLNGEGWEARMSRIALASAQILRALESATDNILTFSDRLTTIVKAYPKGTIQETLKRLKDDGVLYQGRQVSRNLLAAAESMKKNLNDEARGVLRYLESKHGRAFITDGPTKLYRIILAASKPANSDCQESVAQLLHYLSIAIDLEVMKVAQLNTETLTGKEGRDTKPTAAEQVPAVMIALMQQKLAEHAMNVLKLMESCPDNLRQHLPDLLLPSRFRMMLSKARTVDPQMDFDKASEWCIADVKARFNKDELKKTGPMLDWAFSLMDGQLTDSVRLLALLDEGDFVKELANDGTEYEVVTEFQDALKALDNKADASGGLPDVSWKDIVNLSADSNQDADLRLMFRKQEREDTPLAFLPAETVSIAIA